MQGKQRHLAGLIFALAIGISAVAILLVVTGSASPDTQKVVQQPSHTPTLTVSPTIIQTLPPTATPVLTATWTPVPTADPSWLATSAAQPVGPSGAASGEITRSESPYTINRATQRTDVIQYTVQPGDNVYSIAERFGISLETIIWSNGRFYMNALRPGLELNILPVDGALHRVQNPVTVQALADLYLVDPYAIIDSDYNQLKDLTPENMLLVGLEIVIPGGTGSKEPIYWEPPGGAFTSAEPSGSFGETSIYQGEAVFGDGQPGSCGRQPIYDGTLPSTRPVYGYVLTNDFSWEHRGVDLAAELGSPVYAVGGGTVIFAGLSDWGYGWTVVIAHGPVMSLYAHLTGDFVWCGQVVEAGQHIANVGSSGNSSGPHLHFEIRNSGGVPQNPHEYLGF